MFDSKLPSNPKLVLYFGRNLSGLVGASPPIQDPNPILCVDMTERELF